MTKRLITAISIACMAIGIHAEELYMTVEMTNGSMVSFLLDDNPTVTYKDGNFVVNKNAETTYAFDDVKNYHFTEKNMGLKPLQSEATDTEGILDDELRIVWTDDETIEIQNTQSGTSVVLVTTTGIIASQAKAGTDGKASIKVPRMAGMYILTAGNNSFKIIRK